MQGAFRSDMGDYRAPSEEYARELELERLAEVMWDNIGQVHDIPGLAHLPKELQD